jgi:hypothetical protein
LIAKGTLQKYLGDPGPIKQAPGTKSTTEAVRSLSEG